MAEKAKKRKSKKITDLRKRAVKYIGYKWVLPLVYQWHCRKPVNGRLVVFADCRASSMPDNFQSIFQKCKEAGFQCEVLLGPQLSESKKSKLSFHLRFM